MAPQDLADVFDPELRTYYTNRLGALDRKRVSYWPTWKDIAQQFAPRRGRFLLNTSDQARRGSRRDQRIIDNTPLLAARTMASGMMAGISSPARPWFRLRLANDQANRLPAVRGWLDEVQKRLLHVFARSNLYNCLHTLYGELGTFGTAVLWVDEDFEDVVRGYTLTVGEYWLASSRRLAVDTLYRTMWWSARQIVDAFGRDAVRPGILSAWDNGQLDREFEIVHAIEPNPNARAVGPGLAPTQPSPAGGGKGGDGKGHSALDFPTAPSGSSAASRGNARCCASRATGNSRPCVRAGRSPVPTPMAGGRAGWRWATASSCRTSGAASSRRSTRW